MRRVESARALVNEEIPQNPAFCARPPGKGREFAAKTRFRIPFRLALASAHAAVEVDAQYLQPLAAVCFAELAGTTVAATEVGFHGAASAHVDAALVWWRLKDFDSQLMAEDAWIGEKRLSARERVQVGAADANAMDANEGLTFARLGGSDVRACEAAWMRERDLFHEKRLAPSKLAGVGRFASLSY